MADVRAMLRQERAARQQATSKSQRPAPAVQPAQTIGSKKRKANDDDDGVPEVRKRSKAEEARGLPAGFFDDGGSTEESQEPSMEAEKLVSEAPIPAPPLVAPSATDAALDEELEAFKRELEDLPLPPANTTLNALDGLATISAAPLSAAELAAQAREELSAQRGRREAEIEAEKEDAARHLEEEFEEMEELEERVKRLRDKREALRKASMSQVDVDEVPSVADVTPEKDIEEESEDGSDVDDWDDWTFRKG